MQPQTTPTQRLATALLGQEVGEWIAERRNHPYRPSWQAVADELREATDGQVDVTREAVRLWMAESTKQAS